MIIDVTVPQLSESVAEATLMNWLKQVGEAVARDENLIDLETDKVVLELPAPAAGVLVEVLKNNGETYLGEAPRYYQCFELTFDTQEDMDFCMASKILKPCGWSRSRYIRPVTAVKVTGIRCFTSGAVVKVACAATGLVFTSTPR